MQDACKPFSTRRQLADSPTHERAADVRKHHQPSSGPTGHHEPGSPLNLRVRGSSPWRRTMSDLAFLYSPAHLPQCVSSAQIGQMRPRRSTACTHRPNAEESAVVWGLSRAPQRIARRAFDLRPRRCAASRLLPARGILGRRARPTGHSQETPRNGRPPARLSITPSRRHRHMRCRTGTR